MAMADDEKEVERAPALYVEHPVTPERKKALKKKYPEHRFIDLRFAPPKDEMRGDDAVEKLPKAAPAKGKGKADAEAAD